MHFEGVNLIRRPLFKNTDILKGKWNQLKGDLKAKWGDLTDDDWTEIGGNKDKLIGKIQEKYGRAKDSVSREVDEFLRKHDQTANMGDMGNTGQQRNTGTQRTDTGQNTNRKQNDPNRKVS